MNTKAANPEEDIEAKKKLAKRELQKELMEAVPNSALAEKKRLERKKQFRNFYYLIGFLFVGYIGWFLFKPYQSGLPYGICKVFIELQAPYPHTVYFSEVEQFSTSVRIWFTKIDPFGEYRLEPMQCFFKTSDAGLSYELERVTIGRREVNPLTVERFNTSIVAILANPPDLTYPTPLPDSLAGLQFDFEAFRKQILD